MKEKRILVYTTKIIRDNLVNRHGVDETMIRVFQHGESISFGSFKMIPLKAKHVKFDVPLVVQTLGQVKNTLFKDGKQVGNILADLPRFPVGDCTAWSLKAGDKNLLHFGSLALDDGQPYPANVDLLSLPYQGNSRLERIALDITKRLRPKSVLLHHTDDAFPPISSDVDTRPFVELMKWSFPTTPVVLPEYQKPISI